LKQLTGCSRLDYRRQPNMHMFPEQQQQQQQQQQQEEQVLLLGI
jgi:hypothetical protein